MNIGNFGLSARSSDGGTSCRIVGPVSGNGDLGQNYLLSLAILYSPVLSDLQRKRAIILATYLSPSHVGGRYRCFENNLVFVAEE